MATIRGGISEGVKLFQMKHTKDKICTALLIMVILVGSVLFTGCDKEECFECEVLRSTHGHIVDKEPTEVYCMEEYDLRLIITDFNMQHDNQDTIKVLDCRRMNVND